MAIGDDFSIAANGDIRHVANANTYTVLELHRWLQDLADDQEASGNDLVDITTFTPSERATDQIITLLDHVGDSGPTFNIDDDAAEYFYNGSITQLGGNDVYSGLVMVGTVEAATQIQVVQDEAIFTSFWTTGLNAVPAENILNQVLIKSRADGADIDGQRIIVQSREFGDTYAEFSVTLGQGNSVAAIFTSNDLNNETAQGTVAAWDKFSNTESYQLLDVAGDGSANEPYYAQWDIGAGTSPTTPTLNDLYEWTKNIGRRGTSSTLYGALNGFLFRGITHEIPYDTETGGGPVENNNLVWGTHFSYDAPLATEGTVGAYYAFSISGAVGKLLAIDTTNDTAVFAIEPGTGPVVDNDVVTRADGTATDGHTVMGTVDGGSDTGGVGRVLADDAVDQVWIQLLSGVAPLDDQRMYETTTAGVYVDTDYADVNGSATSRTVSPEFIGASTGSNLIGAFGIGIDPLDAVVGDTYTPLDATTVNPPNNVTFSVGGLVSGEDRVLVTIDGSQANPSVDYDHYTLNTTLAGGTETSVVVTTTIDSDTPDSGTIRIELDTGIYRYQAYNSFTGSTFAITSADYLDPDDATAPANVFVSFIDKLAGAATEEFTVQYDTNRTLFVRVRDGGTAGDSEGIRTFETTATLGTNGGSTTAIRTSDA